MLPKPIKTDQPLMVAVPMEAAEPLWKRAPRQDENGCALLDVLMILPELKNKPQQFIEETIRKIEQVLQNHTDIVVFADFNLKLNVLYVMIKQTGINCWELAGAINKKVPEALLVAQPRFY